MVLSTTGLKLRSEGVPFLWVWMEVIFSALFLHKNNCYVQLNTYIDFVTKVCFTKWEKEVFLEKRRRWASCLSHIFPHEWNLWIMTKCTKYHSFASTLARMWGPAKLYIACKFFTFFPIQMQTKGVLMIYQVSILYISIASKTSWENRSKILPYIYRLKSNI